MRYLLFCLFFLLSCAHQGLELRDREHYPPAPLGGRYALPDLPDWANFSSAGDCHRNQEIKYFDFQKLRKDFSFSYEEAVQFQYLYNLEYQKLKGKAYKGLVPFKEQNKLFYHVYDRIKNRLLPFQAPLFKRVHLIWIDAFLKQGKNGLKKLLQRPIMMEGHPVFISLCLEREKVEELVHTLALASRDVKILSMEAFSPFQKDFRLAPGYYLDFSEILSGKQKVLLFTTPKRPNGIQGNFEVKVLD